MRHTTKLLIMIYILGMGTGYLIQKYNLYSMENENLILIINQQKRYCETKAYRKYAKEEKMYYSEDKDTLYVDTDKEGWQKSVTDCIRDILNSSSPANAKIGNLTQNEIDKLITIKDLKKKIEKEKI